MRGKEKFDSHMTITFKYTLMCSLTNWLIITIVSDIILKLFPSEIDDCLKQNTRHQAMSTKCLGVSMALGQITLQWTSVYKVITAFHAFRAIFKFSLKCTFSGYNIKDHCTSQWGVKFMGGVFIFS